MRRIDPWQPGILVSVGVALGTALGLSYAPLIFSVATDAWIGFAGSILGGIIGGMLTVYAGYLAWLGVQEQNDLTRHSLEISADSERRSTAEAVREVRDNIDMSIRYIDKIMDDADDKIGVSDIHQDLYLLYYNASAIGRFTERVSCGGQSEAIMRDIYSTGVNIRIAADDAEDFSAAVAVIQTLRRQMGILEELLDKFHPTTSPAANSGPKS